VAGVVADWERPSSFSPLVRFASRELGILLGGVLLLVGGLLLLRAARSARLDGALLWASGSALAASLVWWGASGFATGWGSLAEQPLVVAVAALSWGFVCSSWPLVLRAWGPAPAAAALSVTPVLLSGLILLEQAVGVAGPQPLIVPGVIAGSLLLAAGAFALVRAGGARSVAVRTPWLIAAAIPAACALVALALPAIMVSVDVTVTGGAFAASWALPGTESVAGWAALALAVLVLVAAYDARPIVPLGAVLVAAAAWPWLREVPTHVWSATLAPEIQVYYGTEYGSILFTPIANAPMVAAVILTAAASLAIIAVRLVRPLRAAFHPDDGGS
jgi:hypothetical protein